MAGEDLDALCMEAVELIAQHGNVSAASRATGIPRKTLSGRRDIYLRNGGSIDPAVKEGMDAIGAKQVPRTLWIKTDANGNKTYSAAMGPKGADAVEFTDLVRDALDDYQPLDRKLFAPRINRNAPGEGLQVIDLADVHFGKLCEVGETGGTYNVEVARHRVIEGTRTLLGRAENVGRILFVMGNDILHTEDGKATTSGTAQDHDGSFFTAWKAAQQASIDAISECAAVADVDLLHCMSNHDWRQGWALSQAIAAGMASHDRVRATEYNMSTRHRKYYGFGRNGLGFTHGDGAKEEKLYGLMATEARDLIVQGCDLFYWYLHHLHHKIAKRRGVDVFQTEKDHTGNMTAITLGGPRVEGGTAKIEYVRSPSAPDGWHNRNAYLNRQAVETFIHHPHDGQCDRFTRWF